MRRLKQFFHWTPKTFKEMTSILFLLGFPYTVCTWGFLQIVQRWAHAYWPLCLFKIKAPKFRIERLIHDPIACIKWNHSVASLLLRTTMVLSRPCEKNLAPTVNQMDCIIPLWKWLMERWWSTEDEVWWWLLIGTSFKLRIWQSWRMKEGMAHMNRIRKGIMVRTY